MQKAVFVYGNCPVVATEWTKQVGTIARLLLEKAIYICAIAEDSLCWRSQSAAIEAIEVHRQLDAKAVRDYQFSEHTVMLMNDYLGPHPGDLPLSASSPVLSVDAAYGMTEDQLADLCGEVRRQKKIQQANVDRQ